MVNWREFREEAPDLAALGEERFERTGLALLGTLRADGSPRISPCEPYIVDQDLLLGMMWRSRKALDLRRDPRLVVHSTVSDRDGKEGDFKLYGRAFETEAPEIRQAYGDATEAKIGWRPTGSFHLFVVDIQSAGFASFEGKAYALAWSPGREVRRSELHPE